ncbi:MAG: single-stranded-DNA-specific exonuclease RecJ [Candidatus Absconditabacterales bacterium]
MNYKILYENKKEDLLTRLFKVRKIDDNIDSFLHPKFADYRGDPFLLNDMDKAVKRILEAIKKKEKIMVFGDYDVDGITSSYVLYKFFTKFLDYKNVSIQYPDRVKEGYGLKKNHIDEIKAKGVDLIITVDNGIASLQEAIYAKEIGIDLIITDHHQDLDSVPEAVAVVNPQISPNYKFKGLAGVGVAFKLVCALLTKSKFDQKKKNQIFNYFLPVVAIGTVADVAPLLDENRVMVKRGLELMNSRSEHIPRSLKGFLEFLNLKENIESYHIGFVIGPRINAGGRISSPYDSLYSLLYSGEKQVKYLQNLEEINTARRKIQETMFKKAENQIDFEKKILICFDEEFHEGIVGIVSGKLTEKYNKPSMIMKIDKEKNLAVASLRGPDYFDVIEMIKSAGDILERFGGHRGAGGLSVRLNNLDKLIKKFEKYCEIKITEENIVKSLSIDTKIYHDEWDNEILSKISKLAPFGEGNEEPVFLIEGIVINKVEKVGTNGKSHLKIHGKIGEKKLTSLFWGKGEMAEKMILNPDDLNEISIIGKVKKDNFNGGYFVDCISFE